MKYQVRFYQDNIYEVVEIITTYGERTSAYDSELDKIEENVVFNGNLSDCEAYIRLKSGGYLK